MSNSSARPMSPRVLWQPEADARSTTAMGRFADRCAERAGRPVRRNDLAERVWGTSLGFVNRSLDVHISSLRHKLGARPDGDRYIDTVHGVGYRLQT